MHIVHVVAARPNFMKAAPVHRALAPRPDIRQTIVHTGQHYDDNMSGVFFRELGLPAPDINLEAGSGSHSRQTGEIMMRFEPVIDSMRPDVVVVYGDVNSTMAAAIVCAKGGVRLAHVEAGLRSFDRTMPEEINRLVTDSLADLLLTPSVDANENLTAEGVPPSKVRMIGNVMIDTLVTQLPQATAAWDGLRTRIGIPDGRFVAVTLHRPSNVDDPQHLRRIITCLADLAEDVAIVFPVHPRTRDRIEGLRPSVLLPDGLRLTDPLGYLDFLALQRCAAAVVTDSGGVQEETTYLGVPCLTLRENTERPVTLTLGTNTLIGRDLNRLASELRGILATGGRTCQRPPLWDGHSGERAADALVEFLS